jgi:hypothetical protein
MAISLTDKLRIKEGFSILPINAPANFKKNLGPLPAKAKIVSAKTGIDQIHWFVLNQKQLEKELDSILKMLKPELMVWVYYPKGTSKIQTDLTRDKGWDKLLGHDELHWISLISFDDTWSTFAFRLKNETDKKKEAKPKVREIFDYIDSVKKTVRIPDDLAVAFRKNKKAENFFNSISFTGKKEYVEWIVTAKRAETRAERVKGSVERLEKGWKNPRNL